MKPRPIIASALTALAMIPAAMAGEAYDSAASPITVTQAGQWLHYSGGNEHMRVEFGPRYSRELGWSLKGAAGRYVSDDVALGLIVEYGDNKREYLANAGMEISDTLSFIGTLGLLEEHNVYLEGEAREEVRQMQYGASLKGDFQRGIAKGFELNAYLADASTDSTNAETGELYGFELLADIALAADAALKLGGGHEWLKWDDTQDSDRSWTLRAEAAKQLRDGMSLTGQVKLGASEDVYGSGLRFDLSKGVLGLNYSRVEGKNGIEDDRRLELSWTLGLGANNGASQSAARITDPSGQITAVADAPVSVPTNALLHDVMKRPQFLPERVLARAAASECTLQNASERGYAYDYSNPIMDVISWLSVGPFPLPVPQVEAYYTTRAGIPQNPPVPLDPYTPGNDGTSDLYLNWNATDVLNSGDIIVLLVTINGECFKSPELSAGNNPPPS